MAEFQSVVDYSTKLENFEGPLDLLLFLVKEAKIEIREIFVSEVTEQFLAYIKGMSVDMDKACEYLNMAATLLEIKSKSLLPRPEDIEDLETQKEDLFRKVEEYKIFKEASEKLKEIENVDRFYKSPDKDVGEVKFTYSDYFNVDGLIQAFSKLLMRVDDKKRQENVLKEIPKEVFTVKDKVEHIRTVLLDKKSTSFFELFSSHYTRNELITTFQALLELLKLQYIKVEQNDIFDDITIYLREDRNEELGEIDEYN